MTRDEKITRGNNAKQLIENGTFAVCMDELLSETFGLFAASDSLDSDSREKLYDDARALRRLRDRLNHYVSDAKMEVANAEYDKSQ